jgi:4-aminobutyrate aminotransferase-like enzyme
MKKYVDMEITKRIIPGARSSTILSQSKQSEPTAMTDQLPIVWDHAEGVWVTDADGNRYIDFTSGVLVTNIGHSHPQHIKAIQYQAARLMNCYSFATYERTELARQLIDLLPENIDNMFLLTTGSEATEAALRIAKRCSKKHEILSFYGAFHGRTYGPMSVAGNMNTRRQFGPPLPGGIIAPYGNCYRCFYDKKFPSCGYFCIDALDTIVKSSSSNNLGAVITEPYQGAAGFIFPPKGWLKRLEDWSRERELILIVDEVQSSFGRTGKYFAIEWEDIRPQMICLGKGLGSGVPISAVGGESKVFACMDTGELSSTTGGNPLSSAAALSVIEIMKNEKLADHAQIMGKFLYKALCDLMIKHEFIGDVRGCGLVMGVEIVENKKGKKPDKQLAKRIIFKAGEYGLILGLVGMDGNVIRIAPPLVIRQAECEMALEILNLACEQP